MMLLSLDRPHTATPRAYVDEIIAKHRERSGPECHLYGGHKFTVLPTVYSPFIAPSGGLGLSFAAQPMFRGKRVLDIGCGSGIVSSMIAASGSSMLVGTDINAAAITNCHINARELKVEDISRFYTGDLFEPLVREEEPFDIIFANLPFADALPVDILESAFFDPELRSIKQFITQVGDWLTADGKAYLCLSDYDNDGLDELAESHGLHWKVFIRINHEWSTLYIIELSASSESHPSEKGRL
ncbi:MAG: methyltransferase domain-containing protein [Chloracidobacterium sp.]|nr:methyltransferase domain-containing protein [Chloracidobacterium sp.]